MIPNKIEAFFVNFLYLILIILLASCDTEKVKPKCPHNNFSGSNPVPQDIVIAPIAPPSENWPEPLSKLTQLAQENNHQGIGRCQIINEYIENAGEFWEVHVDCKAITWTQTRYEAEWTMRAFVLSGECYRTGSVENFLQKLSTMEKL